MTVNVDDESLDLSGERTADGVAAPSLQLGDPYDPRPQEDGARRIIAYLLIGLLWLTIGAMFVLVGLGTIQVADIKEFAVVLGPVVTLVSAATGFYYGTKTQGPAEP